MLLILSKKNQTLIKKVGAIMAAVLKCVFKIRLVTNVSNVKENKTATIQVSKTTLVI